MPDKIDVLGPLLSAANFAEHRRAREEDRAAGLLQESGRPNPGPPDFIYLRRNAQSRC
jgi:hypothetical protein